MAILFCHNARFAYGAVLRERPEWARAWAGAPVALVDDDGAVWTQSPEAAESGVQPGLTARQARTRCPDLKLVRVKPDCIDEARDAFERVLTGTGLPVEIAAPGSAYCDLNAIARSPKDAQPVCGDLGRQLRAALGDALVPALGCDHGKFTARAAAHVAAPGRMRVVDQPEEAAFLAPLSVTLLPLPLPFIKQLHWLGITTLAAFARLPVSSVVQRWGAAGKIAQQLAQGRDDRPVQPTQLALPEPASTDFEQPCESADLAAAAIARDLGPCITQLSDALLGCQSLTLSLEFLDRSTQSHAIAFAAPVWDHADAAKAVARALTARAWAAPLVAASVRITAAAELPSGQLALFDDFGLDDARGPDGVSRYDDAAQRLGRKHPGAFHVAHVVDAAHPAPERRSSWTRLGAA